MNTNHPHIAVDDKRLRRAVNDFTGRSRPCIGCVVFWVVILALASVGAWHLAARVFT